MKTSTPGSHFVAPCILCPRILAETGHSILKAGSLLLVLVCAVATCAVAQDDAEKSAAPKPVTTGDPKIPVDELELLLKPLTKSQLVVEADAWQALVQEKAEEISRAEIAVKRLNREIARAEEVRTEQEAAAGGNQEEAKEETEAAAQAEDAEVAGKQEKVDLLEDVTGLREEQTVLLDRFRAVLEALEDKTDENDSETVAKLQDYRLYASAVRGIQVDVRDRTSAMIAIKGWLLSEEGGKRWLLNIAKFIGILVAAWIVSKIFSAGIHRALKQVKGTSRLLENFLVKGVRWVILAVGMIMALAALEVSIGPLLAVVGAAGFVIAFALQDTLSNFASGIMILFFKPFDEGDVVEAGGIAGKVESMNLVSTTVNTFDNKRMVVPNNKIWNDVITNATGVTERRIDMEFGIAYDADIDEASKVLEEIITSHPKVLEEPAPTIRVHALADSSVNFIVRPWAKTVDYWDVYWDVTREVKKRFDAVGIGIPFPQRDVHLILDDPDTEAKVARLVTRSTPKTE